VAKDAGVNNRDLSDDMRWALRLARAGNDRIAIVNALKRRHPRHGHNSAFYAQMKDERGLVAANRYAERTADKALATVKEAPAVTDPHEARVRLLQLHALVDVERWPPELAGARRALEAAYVVAFERGRIAGMKLDLRTWAMRAGQSFDAIQHHRDQLNALGWMRLDPHASRRLSQFTFYAPASASTHRKSFQGDSMCPAVLLAHDAWRPKGQGNYGWYTWWLENRGASVENALRELDLIALHAGTINSGYRQGMRFFGERAKRRDILCVAEADDAA
jgi:hypothetical protein